MFLELAENESMNIGNYLFVPGETGGGSYIHVRAFDDMPDWQFEMMLSNLEPFQPDLAEDEFSLSAGDRKKWKRQKRDARLARKEAKTQQVQSRAESRKMKAEGLQMKRSGKGEMFAGKGSGFQQFGVRRAAGGAAPGEAEGRAGWQETASNILGTVGGIAGQIFGGGGGQEMLPPMEPEKTWIQKNWPILAIGAVVVVGGVILITRKK